MILTTLCNFPSFTTWKNAEPCHIKLFHTLSESESWHSFPMMWSLPWFPWCHQIEQIPVLLSVTFSNYLFLTFLLKLYYGPIKMLSIHLSLLLWNIMRTGNCNHFFDHLYYSPWWDRKELNMSEQLNTTQLIRRLPGTEECVVI